MAFTYLGNNSQSVTGATEIDLSSPAGLVVGAVIIGVFAFENVAAGSGPWIIPNTGQFSSNYIGPAQSWQQLCWQAPSATGVGIEVWGAIWGTGTAMFAKFVTSQNAVGVCAGYSGEYNPGTGIAGAPPRVALTAAVVGNRPAAPAVVANSGELIVACGGDLMTGSLFGTPSGFTNRVDLPRSGAGTVEATIADQTATVAGNTGPITFPNNAAATTTAGSTATLLIRPQPTTTTGAGGIINAGLPEDLDIGPGYTLRVAALDPATGTPVSGVTVSNVILTVDDLTGGGGSNLEVGPFMLVPGPGA